MTAQIEIASRSAAAGRGVAKRASTGSRAPARRPARARAEPAARHQARDIDPFAAFWRYQIDFYQRSVLFLDTMRERAAQMIEHERTGLPPALAFDHETILDAREFERPANYALLRVTETADLCADESVPENKRPVVVIDPRAGHGPGIGGFKRDSEVGMALHEGHPVYFVIFFPEPCAGQTLVDVLRALRRFVEEVSARHHGVAPVLYGNCQAGWAVALLSADCAGLSGPAVLNGSPLSYWAGEPGLNTMRIMGGLAGGAWLTHFLSDLGGGTFDGAWLVQCFEALNPGSALWDKYADLLANIDSDRERFLDFERWWGGFYGFSREEILSVVENLFIGNRLEKGKVRVCEGCFVDLKRIRNPLVIFASYGDNITPPQQALGWIPEVHDNTAALKKAGQRIVYLINPHVGHLGIFVSAKIARLEHRAILESLDAIEALEPGLYEMKIESPTGDPDCREPRYVVRFEPRRVEDLSFDHPQAAFERAREVSEVNEAIYSRFASPWVQAAANPWTAAMMRWLHPMRLSRQAYSEAASPWMAGVACSAAAVKEQRQSLSADNPFVQGERAFARGVSDAIELAREHRDDAYQRTFEQLYGWPDTVESAAGEP